MRKNTWYAIYHQRELDYLARSYQPGYFFMLMGGKPLTEYLPIDGHKPMEGDLYLGTYKILDTGNIIPNGNGIKNLGLLSSKWLNVYSRILRAADLVTSPAIRPTGGNNTGNIGSATVYWLNLYIAMIHGFNAKFTGDLIDMPNLPAADPHVAGRLWNNAGVVNISAG